MEYVVHRHQQRYIISKLNILIEKVASETPTELGSVNLFQYFALILFVR